ncbi:MAG TPA: PKD domain-containing protein [Solirubrobacteraceae bacterium]|jgi:PKD repeat protein|nr:PKD domain-containing protein [Solirubrobacteraceae bacterium]
MVTIVFVSLMFVASDTPRAWGTEQYGEVTRFGGYEVKASAPDRFSMPVGFAVDSESDLAKTPDGNAVFVLDLVENHIEVKGGIGAGKGTLRYMLHELSSTGEELGHAEIVESYTDTEHFTDAHPLISLAVDAKRKRVYATVESIVRESGAGEWEPVVDELVAWNTEPNGQDELVAATGFKTDTVTKSAGLVAELSGSEAASDLYAPQALAVANGANTAGDVVVEAQNGIVKEQGGAAVLKEIATEGSSVGKIVASWEASTELAPAHEPGGALFAATDGSGGLGVGFGHGPTNHQTSIMPLVGVSEDLTSASSIDQDTSAGADLDQAPAAILERTPNDESETFEGHSLVKEVNEAGGSVTQLIGGEHLYAALYGNKGGLGTEPQANGVPVWQTGGKSIDAFWMEGTNAEEFWANLGIRLVNSAGHVIDTIGGGEPKGPPTAGASALLGSCDIDYGKASIAAGAKESVFVLTSTNKKNEAEPFTGNEVIEFAPGGSYKCPTVTGNIEVNGAEVQANGSEAIAKVAVQQGVSVKFGAASLDRPVLWNPPVLLAGSPFVWGGGTKPGEGARPREWAPFAFEWNFGDEPGAGPHHDGYTTVNEMGSQNSYGWPTPEAEHVYKEIGSYEASVRVYGDFGTSIFPIKVNVLASGPPTAKFTVPASLVAGRAAEFNASASKPTDGAEIEDYHWEFGDGVSTDTHSPKVTHTYSTAKEYTVTLTVHDNEGSEATAKTSEKVTVTAEATGGGGGGGGGGGTVVTTTTTTTTSTTKTAQHPPPESNAEKLAKALKTCHKQKQRKRRVSCERSARKKYASKKAKAGKRDQRHK